MLIPRRISSFELWPSSCPTAAPRTLPALPREALAEAWDLTQLHTRADDGQQQRVTEDPDEVVVDLIGEPGGAGRVRAGHPVLEAQTRSVREDHALPRDEDALLPVYHLMVVEPDQPGALRNQEMLAGRSVEDRLADLRDQLSRKVRA